MKEVWKDIDGYGGLYKISSLGRVKSYHNKPKLRKLADSVHGYKIISLYKDGVGTNFAVHRLVASAFISNPENKPYINHKDGIKHNNTVENLEWCTQYENMKHASETGLLPLGEYHCNSKLTEVEVLQICDLLDNTKLSQKEIAIEFSIHPVTVTQINTGKIWNWLTDRLGNVTTCTKGGNNPSSRLVVNCRGEVFKTMQEAAKEYNMKYYGISDCCRGKIKSSGKYPDGTKIVWSYYNG